MSSDRCFSDQGCLSVARSEVVKLKVSADPFELNTVCESYWSQKLLLRLPL